MGRVLLLSAPGRTRTQPSGGGERELTSDRTAHEEGLAKFVIRERRQRFISSLSNERLRKKLGRRLAHHDEDFDDRYVVTLEQHTKAAEFDDDVYRALRKRGAPETCFIVAPGNALDGTEAGLQEALLEFMDYGPALISCVPAKLGLYIGEAANPLLMLYMPR